MTTNHLKLYHSTASPNSRRVRMFLAEKGLTVPLVPVDLAKGEQHSDAYRVINARRVVPTLVLEDGTAIGEVLAIWRYLEEAYPTPPLLGSTPKDKALVTMWERRAELEGFAAVMEGVRNASVPLRTADGLVRKADYGFDATATRPLDGSFQRRSRPMNSMPVINVLSGNPNIFRLAKKSPMTVPAALIITMVVQ
jgi:glutathione S-transferase